MRSATRKFAALGVAAAVALIVILLILDFADPFNDAPFEKAAWLANPGDRLEMARSATKLIQPGMSESAVIDVLGPPDEIYATRDRTLHFGENFPVSADQTLVYWIGSSMRTSFRGLDSAFVYVHLSSGEVVAVEIGGG